MFLLREHSFVMYLIYRYGLLLPQKCTEGLKKGVHRHLYSYMCLHLLLIKKE